MWQYSCSLQYFMWISPYIRKYKKKDFTLKEYWISIVDLKRDFDIEERMN